MAEDFFETLDERAEDPFELEKVPTQALLDNLRRRMERGEAVPEINYWIACMASRDLIKEFVLSSGTLSLAWCLDTVVQACCGSMAEYQKWVADFEKNGKKWDVGVAPEGRRGQYAKREERSR